MTSGSGLRRLCLAGARASAVRAPTIVGFLNALLWMARSGSRWRDLPRQLGKYEAVKRRYYRWIEMGVLDEILAALGRSRGGLSTKIHAAGDALGNPVRLIGSPGQRNDIAFAHELIEGFAPDVTIADKGYDADHLCAKIAESGAQPVIPPKRNRTFKRPYDAELYKERNIIERFFNKLKQFRRVATRYDKLLANFMGFVKLAAIAIWLK